MNPGNVLIMSLYIGHPLRGRFRMLECVRKKIRAGLDLVRRHARTIGQDAGENVPDGLRPCIGPLPDELAEAQCGSHFSKLAQGLALRWQFAAIDPEQQHPNSRTSRE